MDKKMSQTKNNSKAARGHQQKSDKILDENNFDEDSGYSHEFSLDKKTSKSKGPQETSKQKEQQKEQEEEEDYRDSGFESGTQLEPIDSKEMVPEFKRLHLMDSKPPNSEIIHDIFRQDEDGDTQVHISISSAPQTITKQIIDCAPNPSLLDIENVFGQSPIHLAVLMGQSSIVRHLIICGAKTTVRDYEGNTPLHLACRNNDLKSVDAILNPISPAELKCRPFSNQATKYPRIPINLEQRNYFGEHCIHIAVQNNNIEILKHLLNAGADVNAREGCGGYSPLHLAVENQNEEMVEFLLKYGAEKLNVETESYGQITAYQLANEFNMVKIMTQLAKFGCQQLSYPESDYEDSSEGSDMDSDD